MSAKFVPFLRVFRTAKMVAGGPASGLATSGSPLPARSGVVDEATILYAALWFARYTFPRAVASIHMVAPGVSGAAGEAGRA